MAQPKADRNAPLAVRNRSFRSESRGRLCRAPPRSREKNSRLGRICSVVNYWSSDIYDKNESGPAEVNEILWLLELISRRLSVPVRVVWTMVDNGDSPLDTGHWTLDNRDSPPDIGEAYYICEM